MSQTVLVADDSQTIRKVVQMALKASPYQVVGVGSAREAMEAAQQLPSVILLDYYMPDGSGYDVCRALKGNQATSQIPVIMLGGTYKNFDADLARSSGASLVVMKPFLTDELIDAIDAAVKGVTAAPAPPVATSSVPAPVQQHTHRPQQPIAAPQQPAGRPSAPPPLRQPTPTPTPAPEAEAPMLSMDTPVPGGIAQNAPPPPRQQPPSGPQRMNAPQSPLPESQPRINVGNSQSQSRIPTSDSNSGLRNRQPTPVSGARAIPTSGSAVGGMSEDQVKEFIREEVKNAVRDELPGLLRNVMGEVFQQKVLPKLLMHSDEKIQKTLDEQLEHRIAQQVRQELERLLAEE